MGLYDSNNNNNNNDDDDDDDDDSNNQQTFSILELLSFCSFFFQVVSALSHLKRHADTQHLLLCALSSDRFANSNFQTGLLFMSVVALYLNREYKLAFDTVKILIARDRHKPLYWNLMARITAKSGDTRHQRYILRLLIKHPDELPLVLYSGHNAAVSASYKFAIGR